MKKTGKNPSPSAQTLSRQCLTPPDTSQTLHRHPADTPKFIIFEGANLTSRGVIKKLEQRKLVKIPQTPSRRLPETSQTPSINPRGYPNLVFLFTQTIFRFVLAIKKWCGCGTEGNLWTPFLPMSCAQEKLCWGVFLVYWMGKTSGNSAKICCIAPIGKALTIHLGVRRRMDVRLAEIPALLPRLMALFSSHQSSLCRSHHKHGMKICQHFLFCRWRRSGIEPIIHWCRIAQLWRISWNWRKSIRRNTREEQGSVLKRWQPSWQVWTASLTSAHSRI